MQLPPNPFTRAITSGQRQLGLWISLGSNMVADVISSAGYDWVLIDMEHSANDMQTVLAQLQVFAGSGTTPLIRPPWNEPIAVKRLLDMGAPGLLFPMVQSAEEAEQAVAATRYPPRGIRGVAGSTRATAFGRISDYASAIEDQTSVIVQIETSEALERAEQIAAVDGVTGVFFGPGDIAADIGLLGQPMHEEVWARILPVAESLIAQGIPVGTLVLDAGFASRLLNRGFTFVACGADSALLARAADQLLDQVKSGLQ